MIFVKVTKVPPLIKVVINTTIKGISEILDFLMLKRLLLTIKAQIVAANGSLIKLA